jgi:hypothetical protein
MQFREYELHRAEEKKLVIGGNYNAANPLPFACKKT